MCDLGNRGMKESGRCDLKRHKSAKWVTFAKKMKELIEKDLGGKVQLLDYTH